MCLRGIQSNRHLVALFLFLLTSEDVVGFSTNSEHDFMQRRKTKKCSSSLFVKTAKYIEIDEINQDSFVDPEPSDSLPFSADKVQLGTLEIPQVGIGTIAWSDDLQQRKELKSLVNTACNNNVAFFDTAERYGSNLKTALGLGWGETERLTRTLLSQQEQTLERNGIHLPQSTPIVATKFTPSPWRTTVKSVVDACQNSRKNLGVEQIDLYQLHMPDIVQPLRKFGFDNDKSNNKDKIYWDGIIQCYNEGLIKNVGVCNYGPTLLMECQEYLGKHGVPLASNQIAYSLIGRNNGAQTTVDKCNELGVKVLAYFPFAMGLLTGKYSSFDFNEETSAYIGSNKINSRNKGKSKRSELEKYDLQRYANGDGITIPKGGITPLLSTMKEIAMIRNKSIAQIALNYIISKGAIPIPGARTESQFIDNIGAMGWRLSTSEILSLEEKADELGIYFEGAGFKRTNEKFVGYGVEKWELD